MNREEIKNLNDKFFLDSEGVAWRTSSPTGTGEFLWWCRRCEDDKEETFETNYVIEKVKTYSADVKYFKEKEEKEAALFLIVKKISDNIIRKEILSKENWSDNDLDLLNILRTGKFEITLD